MYRDKLLRAHRRSVPLDTDGHVLLGVGLGVFAIEVDLAHVGEYDAALLDLLLSQPTHILPPFEQAAADALRTLLHDLKENSNTQAEVPPQPNVAQYEDENAITSNPDESGQNGDGPKALPNQFRKKGKSADQQMLEFTGTTIQILLKGNMNPVELRQINATHMNRLIKCPGIIISASRVQSRASSLRIRCPTCQDTKTIYTSGPFSGAKLPTKCSQLNQSKCPTLPYAIFPDDSTFVDQQSLKLQECPESVPTGEMPRNILLAVERSLVDTAPPGTRVSVLGVATVFQAVASGGSKGSKSSVRTVYLRVVGLQRDDATSGDASSRNYFSPKEEEAFRLLARRSDIYSILSRSIAPSISGSYTVDIKKAITCMLFGGSQKRLPDGMRLRGDINVLLLGDPSTAKSQFLKFANRVAPIGVYTSGKGSSAAGLTASVVRDARGEFYLEGGAMVLADGGVVCIDEFDKMRPADRVAIHEAMEQQTISVAKAGITTVLNSRTSVLAAANPVFGRYDDMKSASENIDLMTTILSRFDMIFLVRDVRDEDRDRAICRHVMGVHINSRHDTSSTAPMSEAAGAFGAEEDVGMASSTKIMPGREEHVAENATRVATQGGELDVATMKKYIQYCRAKCSPRLSNEASDVLASNYVKIRDDVRRRVMDAYGSKNGDAASHATIPITVRQLEALVRLSESLAKMRLSSEVHAEDVAEALRLFRVSTMAANAAGGGGSDSNAAIGVLSSREDIMRVENFLRSRLVVGTVVNKQRIVEEAAAQGHDAMLVARVMGIMTLRGEIQERNQSRLIKRIK